MNSPLVHLAIATTAIMHLKNCRVFVLVARSEKDRKVLRAALTRAGWKCYELSNVPTQGMCVVFEDGCLDKAIEVCSKNKRGKYLVVGTQEPRAKDVEYLCVDGISLFPMDDCVKAAKGIVVGCEPTPDDIALWGQIFGTL